MSVSGITFIAYKHPEAYNKIAIYLFVLHMFIIICIGVWNVAVAMTIIKLHDFLQADKINAANTAAENLLLNMVWTVIINISIITYLFLLLFLENIFKHGDKKEPK